MTWQKAIQTVTILRILCVKACAKGLDGITTLTWRRERTKQASNVANGQVLTRDSGIPPKEGQLTQTRNPRKITRGWIPEQGGSALTPVGIKWSFLEWEQPTQRPWKWGGCYSGKLEWFILAGASGDWGRGGNGQHPSLGALRVPAAPYRYRVTYCFCAWPPCEETARQTFD